MLDPFASKYVSMLTRTVRVDGFVVLIFMSKSSCEWLRYDDDEAVDCQLRLSERSIWIARCSRSFCLIMNQVISATNKHSANLLSWNVIHMRIVCEPRAPTTTAQSTTEAAKEL